MRVQVKLFGVAAVALSTLLSACGQSESAVAQAEAAIMDTSAVAAMVNGEPVYVSDVQMEAEAQRLVEPGEPLEVDSAEFSRVLDQLIDVRLLAVEARTRGLDEDPQVRMRLQAAHDRILGNILIDDIVADRVDEAAIRKMYEAQVAIMEMGEEARVRHILSATKEESDQIIAQLKTGIDFAVLAAQKSADEVTRLDGGDLGYMKEDESTPEFARALRSTPTGGVSKPFETQEGWHVIKVEERRPEQPPSLEELRPLILEHLSMMQLDEVLKELRQKGKIQRATSPQGNSLEPDPFTIAPEGRQQQQQDFVRPRGPVTFDAAAPEAAAKQPATAPAPAATGAAQPAPAAPAASAPVGEARTPAQ